MGSFLFRGEEFTKQYTYQWIILPGIGIFTFHPDCLQKKQKQTLNYRMRKAFLFLTILCSMTSCKTIQEGHVCGLASYLVVEPEFRLENFTQFIDPETNLPLETLQMDTNRVFSPGNSHYFEFTFEKGHHIGTLYNSEGKELRRVPHLDKFDRLIWLTNGVIIDWYADTATGETLINLKNGRKKDYPAKGLFIFIGQDADKAFFVSHSMYNKIGGKLLKDSHSIVSISKRGLQLEVKNNNFEDRFRFNDPILKTKGWIYVETDTVLFYEYYNSNVSIECLRPMETSTDAKPLRTDFLLQGKVIHSPDSITFFTAGSNSYTNGDTTYLMLNQNELYRTTPTSFEKVLTIPPEEGAGYIRDFKVVGSFLIFTTQDRGHIFKEWYSGQALTANGLTATSGNYGYYTLRILDLRTQESFCPRIEYQ